MLLTVRKSGAVLHSSYCYLSRFVKLLHTANVMKNNFHEEQLQ